VNAEPRMVAWLVFLAHRHLTTVYFTPDCSAEYVRRSLIDHDGMHPNIFVRRRGY